MNGALLEAAYLRIRALHKPVGHTPGEWPQCVEDGHVWPCATIRALPEEDET